MSMRHNHRLLVSALSLLPLLGGGCLINAGGESVVRRSEQRRRVEFESEEGLIRFQQTVRQRGGRNERYMGRSEFAVPFLISVDKKRVLSENAHYNDEVAAADVNGDGELSDAEVRAYSGY